MHTDGESLSQEKVRKQFSKQTGQAATIRCKAWPDKHSVYMDLSSLSSNPGCFPILVHPQIT